MLLVAYSVQRHHRAIHTAAIEHERAEYQAMHDALTGLPNRHLLTDRFDQALHRWQRHGTKFALFIIDLDHFKKINDSHGHEAGDAVLIATSARILQAIRASDTVARYGGDEFIVLIADVLNETDALALGEKLCDLLRQPVAWAKPLRSNRPAVSASPSARTTATTSTHFFSAPTGPCTRSRNVAATGRCWRPELPDRHFLS